MKINSAIKNQSARLSRPSVTQALEQRTVLAAITSGQYVAGTLASPTATASYTFSANTGDSIVVAYGDTAANAFVPKVVIQKPDGSTLLSDFSGTGGVLESLSLATAGNYTLIISDNNSSFAGSYAVSLAKAPAAQTVDGDSGPLSSGVSVAGAIDSGDIDVYTFAANTGDSVELALATTASTSLVGTIEVFAPGGSRIGSNFSGTGSNLEFDSLGTSGTYTVVVRDSSGLHTGNYALTMLRAPASQPINADSGPITSGQYKTGTIDPGDIDVYTFTANVGDNILVAVGDLGTTAFVPSIQLFGPAGNRLSTTFSGTGAHIQSTAATAGTYTIAVHDNQGLYSSQYGLTLLETGVTQQTDQDSSAIISGQQLVGTIDPGDADVYTISATAGQTLEVAVGDATSSTFVTHFDLYNPSGTLLDSSFGGNGSGGTDVAATNGTYTLFIYDNGGTNTGSYHVSLTRSGVVPVVDPLDNDNATLASSQSRSGAITAGDQDDFTYNFTTGTAATINVKDLLNNTFSPLVQLFSPTGAAIDADAESVTSSVIIPANAASGTYLISVADNSFGNVGNYSIAVNSTPGADTRAPNVTTARFDYAAVQQQVVLTTNESIGTSLGVGDLTLAFNGTPVDSSNLSASFNAAENEIIVQFPLYPNHALPDGNYSLTLGAGTVNDTASLTNASAYTYNFFSLAGDANHDRTVNIADLGILATSYGGLGRNFAQGDFNYDGTVNIADLGILATNYGKTIAAPTSPRPASYTARFSAAAGQKTPFASSRVASDVLNI